MKKSAVIWVMLATYLYVSSAGKTLADVINVKHVIHMPIPGPLDCNIAFLGKLHQSGCTPNLRSYSPIKIKQNIDILGITSLKIFSAPFTLWNSFYSFCQSKLDTCCPLNLSILNHNSQNFCISLQMMGKPCVVFVLGGPGAGKGTQCIKIAEFFGYTHISAGDCLRKELKVPNSKYRNLIESYIKDGMIVPVDVTVNLIRQKMENCGWSDGKFIIDGFPRNQDNLDGWNRHMKDIVDLKFCLFLECEEQELLSRLLERGKYSDRTDDNINSINKRLETYKKDTLPIIQWFKENGKYRIVDAGKSIDIVWQNIKELFLSEH